MEAVTPDTREQLNAVLDALRNDREKGWRMLPDGRYALEEDGGNTSSQEALYRYFSTRKVSLHPARPEPERSVGTQEKPVTEDKGGLFAWLRRIRKS